MKPSKGKPTKGTARGRPSVKANSKKRAPKKGSASGAKNTPRKEAAASSKKPGAKKAAPPRAAAVKTSRVSKSRPPKAPARRKRPEGEGVGSDRLQKVIAASGVCSRRKAEELILEGRVAVNGVVCTELGTRVDPSKDRLLVDGRPLEKPKAHLYLFNKPVGVLSTMRDEFDRPCLRQYTRELPVRVFSIGRLDQDVAGLLLLTNDGELGNQLLHPSHGVKRRYWARCKGRIEPHEVARLQRGLMLEDGPGNALEARRLKPGGARLERLGPLGPDEDIVEIVVGEGRKHFVKRLLAAWGHPVKKLVRVAFGEYQLGNLRAGEIREIKLPRN